MSCVNVHPLVKKWDSDMNLYSPVTLMLTIYVEHYMTDHIVFPLVTELFFL